MKHPRILIFCIAITFSLCLETGLRAQGTAFTYQGRLNDGSSAANGRYDLRFILFDVSEFGNPVAPILTNINVNVSSGLFVTTLDFGANSFTGTVRYLEIGVRTNGIASLFTTLVPRQAILPSPYAVFSTRADLLDGFSANTTPTANTILPLNGSGKFPNSVLSTGSGNGLDADSLDGLNSTAFLLTGGKAADADLLDGLDSTGFWKITGNGGTSAGTHFVGTTDNQSLELRVNGLRALRVEPAGSGTPNLIVGASNNGISSATNATIAGGSNNKIRSTDHSFIAGGDHNEIGGGQLTSFNTFGCNFVGAGSGNYITTNNNNSFIGGGSQCYILTNSSYSFVGGGLGCRISDSSESSVVVGGSGNSVYSPYNFVGGGYQNLIFLTGSDYAAIVGGIGNLIRDTSPNSSIGGGSLNKIFGASYATIPGGFSNRVSGDYAFAAGRRAKADHEGTFVWADAQSAEFSSTASNQFLIRASGGVGIGTGSPSRELEIQHTGDTEIGLKSTDSNGHLWTLQSTGLSGDTSVDASFQIIDRTVGSSRLLIRTNGNVGIGTSTPTNKLHVVGGVSATAFVTTSDRNAKENFAPVNVRDVLAKVVALPISKWNFKEMNDGSHIGPMAQDFYTAFGLGGSDKTITSIDPDGVALAAIQGLNEISKEKDAKIAELEKRLEKLEKLLAIAAK